MAVKSYSYHIYAPGGTKLGVWDDAPPPRFGLRTDGYDSLSVRLPRLVGLLGEPGEPGSDGTMADENRVDVYVADADTLADTATPPAYGAARYGTARYGVAPPGRLVYRGLIRQWEPDFDGGSVEVLITPLAARLDEASVDALDLAGDVVALARYVVEHYAAGLRWHADNPATGGQTVSLSVARRSSVRDVLGQLRELAGANWQMFVTVTGAVRFFAADVDGTPDHRFVAGVTATRVRLTRSAIPRHKRVVVVWANGEATATAPDYDADDPRELVVAAEHLTEAATALALAQATLAARNRLVFRGECTIPDAVYDIESISPGDTVRLLVPRPLREEALAVYGRASYGQASYGGAGYADFAGRSLVVAGLSYDYTSVRLELDQTQPRQVDEIARLSRRVDAAARRRAPAQLVRDPAGTLKTTDAITFPQTATAEGPVVLKDEMKHEGDAAGFFGTEPVSKPAVAGDWTADPSGTGKALATALGTLGLLTDNTTT